MRTIKTDEESIGKLLNSLNAHASGYRPTAPRLADLLITAQATIAKLEKEVKELRKEKEDHE